VRTALKAVLTAEEHEARERFLFRGRAIFGPNIDVDGLREVQAATFGMGVPMGGSPTSNGDKDTEKRC
jgi:hypothetical protein